MKFGNHVLRTAANVRVGDRICFTMSSSDYVVTEVEDTEIGAIRFQHRDGSSCYQPRELLYVENR